MQKILDEHGPDSISVIIITVTCNNNGGQPVSMANIKAVSEFAQAHNIPVVIDSARLAENAWFIKTREPGYADKDIREITQSIIDDIFTMTMIADMGACASDFTTLQGKLADEGARLGIDVRIQREDVFNYMYRL